MPEARPSVAQNEVPGPLQVERAMAVHGLYMALHAAEQLARQIRPELKTRESVYPAPKGELFAVTSVPRRAYAEPIVQGTFDPEESFLGTSPGMVDPEPITVAEGEPAEPFLANRLVVTPSGVLAVSADGICRSFDQGSGDYISFIPDPEAQQTSH